jgi:hypothetical protein
VFIITWDTAVSALQFDGLTKSITTNVIDDNNNALGFRTDLLNQAIETLVTSYGVIPTAIYTGYGMQRVIDDSLSGDVRVNLNSWNEVSTWLSVKNFTSMVGNLPFVNTTAITWDAVTYVWNTVETIYIVCEKETAGNVLYMEDLIPLNKSDIGRAWTAVKFMVTQSTVLVNRAQEFHVKITNVRVK